MWVEKHGKTHRIRERVGGQVVTIQGGYPNKTSAASSMKLLVADQMRGDGLLPRGGTITLADFVDEWWPHYRRSLKPTSVQSEHSRLRNHIVPLLGRYALDEIDTALVNDWVGDLENGVGVWVARGSRRKLTPKTVHNCHGMLFVILSAAIAAKRIRVNPCSSTSLPKRTHREMMFLTDPEIGRLVAAMPAHWRPLVMLLVATGLRWGEAIGLRVKNLDLLATKPKLRVLEHLHEMGDGSLVWTDPKTDRSRRTVSFTLKVALSLTPLVAGKEPDDTVFVAPKGGPVRTRNFRRTWLKAIKAAKLDGLRVHDLRHTHAALLIAANRPLSGISRRLGHSSVAVTDTLYGHLREEVDDGILDAVADAMKHIVLDEDDDRAAFEAEVEAELVDEVVGVASAVR
jgi:integrase